MIETRQPNGKTKPRKSKGMYAVMAALDAFVVVLLGSLSLIELSLEAALIIVCLHLAIIVIGTCTAGIALFKYRLTSKPDLCFFGGSTLFLVVAFQFVDMGGYF